jgi:hypothetical protein
MSKRSSSRVSLPSVVAENATRSWYGGRRQSTGWRFGPGDGCRHTFRPGMSSVKTAIHTTSRLLRRHPSASCFAFWQRHTAGTALAG